jgi:hypothetical protein
MTLPHDIKHSLVKQLLWSSFIFGVLFSVIAIAQYYYVKSELISLAASQARASAKEIVETLAYKDHWSLEHSLGDTIYVLSYTGEGTYDLWYRGKTLNDEVFWRSNPSPEDSAYARLVDGEKMTWWVLLTNSDGVKGWLPLVNNCPDGGACFGDGIIDMIPRDSHGF